MCNFVYFGSIFHVITNGLFLCQAIPKLDFLELANYIIWKKRRMWWIRNRDSQPAAPWLFVPFENNKGTFKWKVSLALGGGSWRSQSHQETTLQRHWELHSPDPSCFPGRSYCRTARSHAEKLQAAWDGGKKLHTAKLSEGSVALGLFRTPGGNILQLALWRTLLRVLQYFCIFEASKAMAKFEESYAMGDKSPASSSSIQTFLLHEKYRINLSC